LGVFLCGEDTAQVKSFLVLCPHKTILAKVLKNKKAYEYKLSRNQAFLESFSSHTKMLQSQWTEDLIEAGVDEVGRGCLAGPVVAAAVILPKNYTHPLLKDSKKISADLREKLRVEIEQVAICYAIAEVSNEEIDQLNILKATFKAMHMAVSSLSVKPELLLIDGNRFAAYPQIPHQCVIKGDNLFLSIAAASVLAKTHRDKLMQQWALDFPVYHWETNVGYPTRQHFEAIDKHGITHLHRKSFSLFKTEQTQFIF
jgi:ribonuclease HII